MRDVDAQRHGSTVTDPPCLITSLMIAREFMRLTGELDSRLVSVTLRPNLFDMAADIEIRGKSLTIQFPPQALAGTLDNFSDHYVLPAVEMLKLA